MKKSMVVALIVFLAWFAWALVGILTPAPGTKLDNGIFTKEASNPLLISGPLESWDDLWVGGPMVLKEGNTYYMFYYGGHRDGGIQIGLATASSPSGPWTKYEDNPILSTGISGSWDDHSVSLGKVSEIDDIYYLWYHGQKEEFRENEAGGDGGYPWQVGLATAPSPYGPWTKHDGNPILTHGAIGEWDGLGIYGEPVVKVDGTFYQWYIGFKDSIELEGKVGLATASEPEGPWTKYSGNPVLVAGSLGEWDQGAISDIEVLYQDGVFHAWYAAFDGSEGTSPASIGYAYSTDGIEWVRGENNPVLPRGPAGEWDDHYAIEPHVLIEDQIIYLFYGGSRRLEGKFVTGIGLAVGHRD